MDRGPICCSEEINKKSCFKRENEKKFEIIPIFSNIASEKYTKRSMIYLNNEK